MNAIRRNQTALTLLCLAGVTIALILAVLLVIALTSNSHPPAQAVQNVGAPSTQETFVSVIGLLLGVPLGWWVFAKMAGGLWRMNDDFFWKLLM